MKGRPAQGPTASNGASGSAGDRKAEGGQTIWTLGDDKQPRPVTVKLGISDSGFSEVVEGDLKDGQELIVGIVSKEGSSSGSTTSFVPRGMRF